MLLLTLKARRGPTPEEIRFGYGCDQYMYREWPIGKRIPKKWRWLGNWWQVIGKIIKEGEG